MVVLRWAATTSLVVLVGSATFVVVVWRPTIHGRSVSPGVTSRFVRRTTSIWIATWLGAVGGSAAVLALPAASDAASGASVGMTFAAAQTSPLVLPTVLRLLILAAVAVGWAMMGTRRPDAGRRPGDRDAASALWRYTVLAGVGLAILATPALSGHAAERSPVVLSVLAATLHLAAAACWMGGLVMLVLVVYPATATLPTDRRLDLLGPAVARFSDMAVAAVAVLVLSGSLRSWMELQSVDALTTTTYGMILIIKVAAFLPLAGLGGINKYWLKPRLERAAGSAESGQAAAVGLRRSMIIEVVLVAFVLAVTAVLVNTPPPSP